MKNIDLYFGSDKVNSTMKFVPGIHASDQKHVVISGLERFEMEGIESFDGVFVCFSVLLINVKQISMKTLTFSAGEGCSLPCKAIICQRINCCHKISQGGSRYTNAIWQLWQWTSTTLI